VRVARAHLRPAGAPVVPRPPGRPLRSPIVRIAWYIAVVLVVIGLGALATTCTGPRPRPTGQTIPPDTAEVTTTTVPAP
jgi:hypothetical protein